MIYTIIIGLIVGFIARMLMPGRTPTGFIITACLGIGGSILATFLGQAVGWYHEGQSAHFIGSTLGAMLLIFIYHLFTKGR